MQMDVAIAAKRVDVKSKIKLASTMRLVKRNWDLYLIFLPVVIYFAIFYYWPMYGLQIAFKDYNLSLGVWASPWVGFKHFERFFNSYYFVRLIKNTFGISIYQLIVGFPAPIILALMMNEVRSKFYKKTVQMVTYAPHFLSTVVLVGMLVAFVAPPPNMGVINRLINFLGFEPIFFMAESGWFKTLYVLSHIWQNAGWGSVIYIAALAGIDPQLYEASEVDGATKLQRLWHVTLPGLIPTVIVMLILETGRIMNVGFEKVFLMQNQVNMDASEIISTYVYKNGLLGMQYSFASAIGLFNSIVNVILLFSVNKLSKRISETSLW